MEYFSINYLTIKEDMMGYYVTQDDCNFFVPADKIPAMIEAIHNLDNGYDYSWVNMAFLKSNDIVEIFQCWRWCIKLDQATGDIVDIIFDGEKLGDDEVLLKAIAPFVKAGSFIEMNGEGNDMWRWYFDGEKMVEKLPTITWD